MGEGVLIDTDILIDYVKGFVELPKVPIFISEITLYEFVRGTKDVKRAKKLLEETFVVVYNNNEILLKAAEIWIALKESDEIVDDRDILIASAAIAKNLPLMTRNLKHFKRLERFGLRLLR